MKPRYDPNRGDDPGCEGPEALPASCDIAVAVMPDYPESHFNRGLALLAMDRPADALESFDRVLALEPGDGKACNNRGIALQALGRCEEANRSFQRAVDLEPAYVDAHLNRGSALMEMRDFEAAIRSFAAGSDIDPHNAEALNQLGNGLQGAQHFGAAIERYDRAIALMPDYPDAHYNRGVALLALEKHQGALESFDRFLDLRPRDARACKNRGIALQALGRRDEAISSFQRAIELDPDYADAYLNRGNVLRELLRCPQALESYDAALAIDGNFAEAWASRAIALQELGRYEDALASFERALAIAPEDAEVHWNRSLCLLLSGDLERGWEEYEWRWKSARLTMQFVKRSLPQPAWRGTEDIRGKTILLHAEQGLGDTIQFCRYVPLVAQRGARVVLEVQPPLKRLMSQAFSAASVLSQGEELPAFDCHCPLLSLPRAFNTRQSDIPATVPYLSPEATLLKKWGRRLGARRGPRIGIAWSGLSTHINDRNRSIPLAAMLRLASPGIELVSLQRDVRPQDEKVLVESRHILHFGQQLGDFSDTAALVALLDLVICVDTSVAHLAGALGKPVWILLPFAPDWRWLADREDSPWYPSVRLFRQPGPGDWASVLEEVKAGVAKRLLS